MAEATAGAIAEVIEPIANPVIKDNFADAKSAFRQAMADEGLGKPDEPKVEPEPEPKTEATPERDKPVIAALPEDVLEPVTESATPSETIAELQAMTLPKNAKPEKVVAFEGIKKKAIADLTAAEARIKELESKISASTSNVEIESLNNKLKAAEEKAAQIEDQWARQAFESSPRFQARYSTAEKNALDSAKSYLEGTEIDPRIIDLAAHTVGKKRLDILSEAGADDKLVAAVTSHLATYDLIQKDKQNALENWRAEASSWQEQETKYQEAEAAKRKENEDRVWESVLSRNNNLLPFRTSKDEQWNARANELRQKGKDIYNGNGADMETMADIVQRGVASYAMEETLNQLVEQIKTLKTENASLKSARPGGTITTSNGQAPAADDSKLSREELSKKTFNEQLGLARGTS